MEAGERLWNGQIASAALAEAYNSQSEKIKAFQKEGRQVPEHLLNGRHNLIGNP